ncbi:MAG: hypothetical protein ACO1OB_20050 [Archangium sp.]
MRFIALATLLSGCTTVMCPGGPAYPIEKSACDARTRDLREQVEARVLSIDPGREEIPFLTAQLEFVNASSTALIIEGYELIWPGGRKRVAGLALPLRAGAKLDRTLRVDFTDGDLSSLDASARVEPAYK